MVFATTPNSSILLCKYISCLLYSQWEEAAFIKSSGGPYLADVWKYLPRILLPPYLLNFHPRCVRHIHKLDIKPLLALHWHKPLFAPRWRTITHSWFKPIILSASWAYQASQLDSASSEAHSSHFLWIHWWSGHLVLLIKQVKFGYHWKLIFQVLLVPQLVFGSGSYYYLDSLSRDLKLFSVILAPPQWFLRLALQILQSYCLGLKNGSIFSSVPCCFRISNFCPKRTRIDGDPWFDQFLGVQLPSMLTQVFVIFACAGEAPLGDSLSIFTKCPLPTCLSQFFASLCYDSRIVQCSLGA